MYGCCTCHVYCFGCQLNSLYVAMNKYRLFRKYRTSDNE